MQSGRSGDRGATPGARPAGETDRVGEVPVLSDRSNRQHAWSGFETEPELPVYHLVLCLDYLGSTPTGEQRRRVEGALAGLEDRFEWGDRGLRFALGYSRQYFERFEESLPAGLADGESRLLAPGAVGPGDDGDRPFVADRYDAVAHFSSTDVRTLLDVEAALWGEGDLDLPATVEGVFARPEGYPERRTGVVRPEDRGDGEPSVPAVADLPAGDGSPGEFLATMVERQRLSEPAPPGVFAQGSVAHLSTDDAGDDADGGMASPLLRRGFRATGGDGHDGYDVDLMRFNGYAAYAYEGDARDGDDRRIDRRGNFLLPPVSVRALPPARALRPNELGDDDGFTVTTVTGTGADGLVTVRLSPAGAFDPQELDPTTIRFGAPGTVNRGGGAEPLAVREDGQDLVVRFATAGADLSAADGTARLFARTTVDAGRRPVFGTADL